VSEHDSRTPLVTTTWVSEHLQDPQVRLVEVDEDTDAYARGHIPGAVALHWQRELQHPVRRNFVEQDAFEKLLGIRGITEDDVVVLYGGNNNWFAAYAYWYFKVYGHEDVRLMDGGRKKWELEGRPLTPELPIPTPARYRAKLANETLRARREEVLGGIGTVQLVDVRSPEEFVGKLAAPAHLPQEQAQSAGTSREPGIFPGRGQSWRTAPSGRSRTCAPCTKVSSACRHRHGRSSTAASVSAHHTPGSC